MSVLSQQECVSSFDDIKVDNVHRSSGPSLQIVQAQMLMHLIIMELPIP